MRRRKKEPMDAVNLRFLESDSEAAQMMRQKAWGRHPLGEPNTWPQELQTSLGLMLASKFPMFVAWGKQRYFFYNDAYSTILGDKHPAALGQSFEKVWSEIWADLLPLVTQIERGESVFLEDFKLLMNRKGFTEKTFFTFSYSPLKDAKGAVCGLFCVVVETTKRKQFEAALNKSQERLSLALEAAKLGVFERDLNKNTVHWSPRAKEILGFKPGILDENFESFLERVEPADRDKLKAEIALAVKDGRSLDMDYRFHRPDGMEVWLHSYAKLSLNSDGTPARSIGVLQDVTQQRLYEERIKDSEDQLKLALSSASMGAWTIDLVSGRTTLSEEARQVFGFESEYKSSGEAIDTFLHPDDRERGKANLAHAVSNHLPYRDQVRIVKPGGEIRWIDTRARAHYNPKGEPILLTGIVTDITEQVLSSEKVDEARRAVETAEQRFKTATLATGIGVWELDLLTNTSWRSESHDRAFGYDKPIKDWGFDTFLSHVHPEDRALAEGTMLKAVESRTPWELECRVIWRDQSLHWMQIRGRVVTDLDDKPIKIIGTNYDISDRKAIEEKLAQAVQLAEGANMTKSAFLANMSHEIRTPLAAILGFSGLLKDQKLDQKDREQYVDTIVRNGQSLTRIIDDILDLAKVEAGKLEFENVPISIAEIVNDAVDLFRDKAKEKGISLSVKVDDLVPAEICSDPTRLRQILVNLIGNAVKFTNEGSVEVFVTADARQKRKAQVTIDVKDTGIGLSAEQQEKLFSPFTQADNSMTRKFGGTGLGLALSQRLAQALSGNISIKESYPGKGCTFSLSFTAELPQKGSSNPDSKTNQESETVMLEGVSVLVIDDSPDNQFLVDRMLSKRGAKVDTASDGDEGYKKAIAGNYDVVLMDLQMPKMDGYQAKEMLDRNGYKKPVIALTAHAMSDERNNTKAAGFSDHLTKPIVTADLIAALRAFCQRE